MVRIAYIDIAKFIGIILMIIGHSGEIFPHATSMIYSFHMPFFFIVSGFFIRGSLVKSSIKKYGTRLLMPYLISALFILLVSCGALLLGAHTDKDIFCDWLVRASFGSAVAGKGIFSSIGAYAPTWFLLALFHASVIYSFLLTKYRDIELWICTLLLFVLAYHSCRFVTLPISIQAGVGAVFFLHVGSKIREYDVINQFSALSWKMKGLAFCLWLSTAWFLGCGMGTLNFPYGFASIISAVMGTILLIKMSKDIKYIKTIGAYSKPIMCSLYRTQLLLLFWKSIR